MPTPLADIEASMSPSSRLFRSVTLDLFLESIPPGSRVLDCGAGDGAVAIPLAQHGCQVDAIDLRAERIDNLRSSAAGLPVSGHVGDLMEYSFEAESYDRRAGLRLSPAGRRRGCATSV